MSEVMMVDLLAVRYSAKEGTAGFVDTHTVRVMFNRS
jgi:hypothetical protein